MKSSSESKMTIPEKIIVHIEKDPTADSTMTANNLALQEMSKNIQMSDKMRQQNANALEKLSVKLDDIKLQQQQQQPSFSISNEFDDFKKMVESQVEMIQTSSNITINDMRQAFQDVTKSYNNLIDNAINIQFKKLGEFYAQKTDMDQRLNEEFKSTPSNNAPQPNNITVNINMDEVIKELQDQHKLISNEILSMIHDDSFKSKVSIDQTNEATNLKSISEVLTTMAKSMHDLMANMINFKQQQTCEKDFTMVTIKDMMTNVIEEHQKVIEKLIQRSDVKVITPTKSSFKTEINAFHDEQIKDITDTLKELKKDKKETQKQIQNMILEQETRRKEQDLLYDNLRTLKTNLSTGNLISPSTEQSLLNKNIEMMTQNIKETNRQIKSLQINHEASKNATSQAIFEVNDIYLTEIKNMLQQWKDRSSENERTYYNDIKYQVVDLLTEFQNNVNKHSDIESKPILKPVEQVPIDVGTLMPNKRREKSKCYTCPKLKTKKKK